MNNNTQIFSQYDQLFGKTTPTSTSGTPTPMSWADKIQQQQQASQKTVPITPTTPSLGDRVANTFKQGGNAVTKDVTDVSKNADKAGGSILAKTASILSGAGHAAGDIAGTTGGLIGDVIAPLIPKAVSDKIGDVSKYISDKVNSIPGMTPDIHKSLSDVFNALSLKGGEEAAPAIEKTAGNVLDKTGEVAKNVTSDISKKVSANAVTKQSDFIDKLITPEMSKKATTSAIKTGKVEEGTGLTGKRDFSEAIPNFDKIKESVAKVPGISSKNTALQNANVIHDAIGTTAEDLKSQLQGKGSFTPAEFNIYMNGIKTTLKENPLITGDAETTANKIVNKFNSLIKTNGYTPSGLLEARKGLDRWMTDMKGSSVFDPKTETAVSTALRGIRQGGNDFIASKVPDVAVKDMLAHQSNLYKAIENIAPKAAKESGSKLGRFTGFIKKHPVTSAIVGDKVLKYTTGIGF